MEALPNFSENNKKSFWKKPEGVTGMIFLGGIVIGALMLLYRFLPVLITIIQNVYLLGGLLVGLFVIFMLAMDPKVHLLIATYYKRAMRVLTNIIVNTDPIGILEDYVFKMKKNHEKMDEQRCKVREEMAKLKKNIDENASIAAQNLKLAQKAKEQSKLSMAGLKAKKAGRLQDSNITLGQLYSKMDNLYIRLTKMHEATAYLIEDTDDMVSLMKRERAAITAGYNAFSSAMQILKGDLNEKELYDLALESVVDDIGMKVGKMEHFMNASQNFVEGIDLQQGVFESEGLDLLDQFEKEGGDKFINDRFLSYQKPTPTLNFSILNKQTVSVGGNEFDNLLKK